MLFARSLTRVVALEALETFLPGHEASVGPPGLCDESSDTEVEVEGDVLKGTEGVLVVPRSKELASEDDSRLLPGMTRPVVSCDWSPSLM